MTENILNDTRAKMEKGLAVFKHELSIIRTGRASLSILDDVKVDYYGTLTPLNQVANLKIADPKMITIHPWEAKMIPEIEKGIMKASLGLTPSNDGKLIRLGIPALNEERRKDLVKLVKKHAEEAKVALRMVRREAIEELKKQEKAKAISEDDLKKGEEKIQKLTDEYNGKIEELVGHKEKDIMSV